MKDLWPLIEHFAGVFPVWLAPVQVRILPISAEKHLAYAQEIKKELLTNGFRVELEKDNETLGKKIRLAKMQRIPYLIIAGEKEIEENDITVENRGNEKGEKMELLKFIEKITS